MTKGLGETIHNYLFASAIFLSPIVFPLRADAEILERKIISSGKEYNITVDSDRREYNIVPEIKEHPAREVLASYLFDEYMSNIGKKKKKLEERIEEFIKENQSEMQLLHSESDLSLVQNVSEFFPFDVPKMDINVWKRGNELDLKFSLQSQEYALDWYKYNSIGIFYPKGTRITREPDKAFVLSQEKDEFERYKIERDKLDEEREAYGKLADAVIEKGIKEGRKEFLGIIITSFPEVENLLAEDEKTRREEVIRYLKSKYDYRIYSPSHFFAVPEQERQLSLKFEGNPDVFNFFVNSDVVLRKKELGSETKKQGALIKLIDVNMKKISDDTPAGKIVRQGKSISRRINEFLLEYEHKKHLKGFDFKEKIELYEDLSLWDAQIYPFINMLSSLQDKEIKGEITELQEHQKFQQEFRTIHAEMKGLNKLVDEYFFTKNYLPFLSNPRKTFDSYKKAMSKRDFRLRDKTRYNAQITRIEKNWIDNKDDKEARKFVSDLEFIREIPYTLEMHKELVRNSVEAEVFMFGENYRAYFIRTEEGWKLDTAIDSDISLVREVYSIMNEIEKNHAIHERIIKGDIPIDATKPTIFPAHYSNFEKLNIYKESTDSFRITTSNPRGYPFELWLKELQGKFILYNTGPDRKDDSALVQYNPGTGSNKGDIWISFDK